MLRRLLPMIVLVAATACGGNNGSPSAPSGPSPQPQPQANRNPVVNSAQVTPTFGIADLTVFNFAATGSDLDGDALTYSWSVGNGTFPGGNVQLLFGGPGGNVRATVTASDGKGGTASGSVDFIVGSTAGTWTLVGGPEVLLGTVFTLNQNGAGIVTGTFTIPGVGAGNTDPAEPGRITAAGELTMRVKVGIFTDFNMTGTMDTTGRMITGSLRGSGFTGQPFVMVK